MKIKYLRITNFIVLLIFFLMNVNFSCKNSQNQNMETFEGTFKSVKGVMDPLSCYCYNSGYLTTDSGEIIPICFNNEDIDIKCDRIKVTGVYMVIVLEENLQTPCPAGSKNIFMVESYECN